MYKLKKKNSGITLIALVITIIVLLILAGISLSMLSGNNGILEKAIAAKISTEDSNFIEEMKLNMQGYVLNKEEYLNIKDYFFRNLELDDENSEYIFFEKANTIVFKYKKYIIIADGKQEKIIGISSEKYIEKENSKTVLYKNILEDDEYFLEVKQNIGWNDRFWITDKDIDEEPKYASKLVTVFADSTVMSFGYCSCFSNLSKLKNVYIPEGFTLFGQETFYHSYNLENIVLPSTIETIGQGTFAGCKLNELVLPKTVKTIRCICVYSDKICVL